MNKKIHSKLIVCNPIFRKNCPTPYTPPTVKGKHQFLVVDAIIRNSPIALIAGTLAEIMLNLRFGSDKIKGAFFP
jgi:hypothetical protein